MIIIPGTKYIYSKMKKILNGVSAVAISKQLYDNLDFKNELYKMNIHILNGRYLFNYLFIDIIKYIVNANESKMEELEIAILANYLDNTLKSNILLLANQCQLINIITNNPDQFHQLSEELKKDYGVMIRVSKNKKKGLLKSGIIMNVDFPQELLNKCSINKKSVIVNLNNEMKVPSKFFSGILVNDFRINELDGDLIQFFSNEIIYESKIYTLKNFEDIRKQIKNDNIKIRGLIGLNGMINIKEFKKNLLTNLEY